MKFKSPKSKMDYIPFLAGGVFFTFIIFGMMVENPHTSKSMPRTSPVHYNTIKGNPSKNLLISWGSSDEPENPEYEYDHNLNFDETQYASDHWDEFLSDPENIDDYPENIFDAQLY